MELLIVSESITSLNVTISPRLVGAKFDELAGTVDVIVGGCVRDNPLSRCAHRHLPGR